MNFDLRKCIVRTFYADGRTYILSFEDNDYVLKMFLGQYQDEFTPYEKIIRGIERITDYLILRCIPMDIYLAIEKIFLNEFC